MTSRQSVLVLAAVAVLLLSCGRHGSAQEPKETPTETPTTQARPEIPGTPDPLLHNLAFSLPMVIVFIIIVIIFIVVGCVMYKGRYGDFCCLKLQMRYRLEEPEENDGGESGASTSLPTYESPKPPSGALSPPDYTDALQDKIIVDEPKKENELEEIPLSPHEAAEDSDDDSIENYDDRTPLTA